MSQSFLPDPGTVFSILLKLGISVRLFFFALFYSSNFLVEFATLNEMFSENLTPGLIICYQVGNGQDAKCFLFLLSYFIQK